jgi:hypothetical protein
MTGQSPSRLTRKDIGRPIRWNLWVVAVAAFLWNAAGAFTIMMACGS